jgi:hypothetical protein
VRIRTITALLSIVVVTILGYQAVSATTDATPPLHLQGAAISASEARFQWQPGNENRYFCLDYARSLNDLVSRTGTWRNSGCGQTTNSHTLQNLACGSRYYVRVWTSAGGGLYSTHISVETRSCETAISEPTNLAVIFTTRTQARLDWEPGRDNRWFCIDTAKSQNDLLNFSGTWRNHACWTTSSQETIGGLNCETTYYWRVFAWNRITGTHSDVRTFRTDDCDTKHVKAPIEDVEVDRVGGEYHARIIVERPNTCHSFGYFLTETSGNIIEVTVYNQVASNGCADVPSSYTLTLNLGSGFFSGVTYIVIVNDAEVDTFTAR